jgi:1-deoxy-D-xylulose-5-phosphate reductoisomerase
MFNAANEVAVQLFLEERIAFGRIAEIIEQVLGRGTGHGGRVASLEEVLAADGAARRLAQEAAC